MLRRLDGHIYGVSDKMQSQFIKLNLFVYVTTHSLFSLITDFFFPEMSMLLYKGLFEDIYTIIAPEVREEINLRLPSEFVWIAESSFVHSLTLNSKPH